MKRTAGLPRDVWDAADKAGDVINAGIWMGDEGPSISWGEARMAIGNAILAERTRCAEVAAVQARQGATAEQISEAIERGPAYSLDGGKDE